MDGSKRSWAKNGTFLYMCCPDQILLQGEFEKVIKIQKWPAHCKAHRYKNDQISEELIVIS
jgi:hypothetical protein